MMAIEISVKSNGEREDGVRVFYSHAFLALSFSAKHPKNDTPLGCEVKDCHF